MNPITVTSEILTPRFFAPLTPLLRQVTIPHPLTIPYEALKHGKNIKEFCEHADFKGFSEKYHALIDQLLVVASALQLPAVYLENLKSGLDTFRSALFMPDSCDLYPALVWNTLREHLEAVVVLLSDKQISAEERLEALKTLVLDMRHCPDGLVNTFQSVIDHLQDSESPILAAKERLTEQLVIEFIRVRQLADNPGMEVHYVNAFMNTFSGQLGLNLREHEKRIGIDHLEIQHNATACLGYVIEKLPVALVGYLANELLLEAHKLFQDGKFIVNNYQDFLTSSLGKFFDQSGVMNALFLDGEAIEEYTLPSDTQLLQLEIARHLMRQGWLQSSADTPLVKANHGARYAPAARLLEISRHLMRQWWFQSSADTPLVEVNQGTLYALADRWFWWQSQEGSSNQQPLRPATVAEMLVLSGLNPLLCNNVLDYIIANGRKEQPAAEFFDRVAKQGSNQIRLMLALRCLNEQSTIKDGAAALRLLNEVEEASLEYAQAQFNLGLISLNSQGFSQNHGAANYFQRAANRGYNPAQVLLQSLSLSTSDEGVDKKIGETQYQLALVYQDGLGVIPDDKKAVEYLELAATQEHDEALLLLGVRHFEGRGVAQNMTAAIGLFETVKEDSSAFAAAQCNLGRIYLITQGDDQKAVSYLRVAAHLGYDLACLELGVLCLRGLAWPFKGRAEALMLFSSIEQGSQYFGQARYLIGKAYQDELGVERDYEKAANYFQVAVDWGYNPAYLTLGLMYLNGQGLVQDYAAAAALFGLVKQGNPEFGEAQCHLGKMFRDGLGMAQDYEKAAEYFQTAVNLGHDLACLELGLLYLNGQGVAQDYAAAAALFGLVERGESFGAAQFNLGLLYLEGLGVTQDYEKAVNCFEEAATWSYSWGFVMVNLLSRSGEMVDKKPGYAQYLLGYFFQIVLGKQQNDYKKAIEYFQKAAKLNYDRACFRLGRIFQQGELVVKNEEKAAEFFRQVEKTSLCYQKAQDELMAMNPENFGLGSESSSVSLKQAVASYSGLEDQGQGSTSTENDQAKGGNLLNLIHSIHWDRGV
jgi:TPR repeat protein